MKRKHFKKRAGVLILSVALLAAMIQPVYGQSPDAAGPVVEEAGQQEASEPHQTDAVQKDELQNPQPEVTEEDSAQDLQTDISADDPVQGSQAEIADDQTVQTAPGNEETDGSEVQSEPKAEKNAQMENVQQAAEEPGTEQAGDAKPEKSDGIANYAETSGQQIQTIATGQYDVTKPVIEGVTLVEQGRTLHEGEIVHLYVNAYDADVGIKEVRAILYSAGNDWYHSKELTLSYNNSEKRYEIAYTLSNVGAGTVRVSSVTVVDYSHNAATWIGGDQNPLQFTIEKSDSAVAATNIAFPQNGQTLGADQWSNLDFSFKTNTDLNAASIIGTWSPDNGYDSITMRFAKGSDGTYRKTSMSYRGEDVTGKKWTLKSLRAERELGQDQQISIPANYSFTINASKITDTEKPVIQSIELNKNGERLQPGDAVNVTVKATDNVGLSQSARLTFRAAADIDDRVRSSYVSLTYDSRNQCYTGTFQITKDTYPCEWYVDYVSVTDTSGNPAYGEKLLTDYPYYVQVYNDGTFVNPAFEVEVNFYALNQKGEWIEVQSMSKTMERRQTLGEAGITFPAMGSQYPGLTQIGWVTYDGEAITEDTQVLNAYSLSNIYAKYDKLIVDAGYSYPTNDGGWNYATVPVFVERGTTWRAVIEKALAYRPADLATDYAFAGWGYDLPNGAPEDDRIPDYYGTYISFEAKFDGKKTVEVDRIYYDERGALIYDEYGLFVDEDATAGEVRDILNGWETPRMYAGLRFQGWEYYLDESELADPVVNGDYFYMGALYENSMIRYLIDPRFETNDYDWMIDGEVETIICQVAEIGETVPVLSSFEGYENVTWTYRPVETDTITVGELGSYNQDGNMDYEFWGYGTKSQAAATPVQPSASGGELSDQTVSDIVTQIQNAGAGETVEVDMGNATIVSKEILEAAKGKNVTIKIDMGGYTWTINGKDIWAKNLKDINMQVILDTNGIPSSTVKKLAGDNLVRQLKLLHEGDFGFKATLTINLGSEYGGLYGNLFYYDSDGKMVFIDAGAINADGTVSLTFSHASDYVIVMSPKKMSQKDVPDDLQPLKSGSNPKTSDDNIVLPWMICVAAAVCTIAVAMARRYGRRRMS